MFRLRDDAFAPRRPLVQSAIKRLPQAHRTALDAGHSHVHQQVVATAREAGLHADSIVVTPHGVDIDDSDAGDALFNHEFGTPESAPNPVLRQTAHRATPEASAIYNETVRREMGLQ